MIVKNKQYPVQKNNNSNEKNMKPISHQEQSTNEIKQQLALDALNDWKALTNVSFFVLNLFRLKSILFKFFSKHLFQNTLKPVLFIIQMLKTLNKVNWKCGLIYFLWMNIEYLKQ